MPHPLVIFLHRVNYNWTPTSPRDSTSRALRESACRHWDGHTPILRGGQSEGGQKSAGVASGYAAWEPPKRAHPGNATAQNQNARPINGPQMHQGPYDARSLTTRLSTTRQLPLDPNAFEAKRNWSRGREEHQRAYLDALPRRSARRERVLERGVKRQPGTTVGGAVVDPDQ